MKKTYVVTAIVDFEVEADDEEDAYVKAEYGFGDMCSFEGKSVECFDDEEE